MFYNTIELIGRHRNDIIKDSWQRVIKGELKYEPKYSFCKRIEILFRSILRYNFLTHNIIFFYEVVYKNMVMDYQMNEWKKYNNNNNNINIKELINSMP